MIGFPFRLHLSLLPEEYAALVEAARDVPALRWLRESPHQRRLAIQIPNAAWAQTAVDALDHVAAEPSPNAYLIRAADYVAGAFRHNAAAKGGVFLTPTQKHHGD
jgi:hypothetical protein